MTGYSAEQFITPYPDSLMRWSLLVLVAVATACSGTSDDGTGGDTAAATDTDTDTTDTDTTDTDTTGAAACQGVAPSVAIGTGVFSYEPFTSGQPVEIVYGSQGGWHLDTAALVEGMGPVVQFKGIATVVSTGDIIAGENDAPVAIDLTTPGLGTWDDTTCTGSFYGQYTFVDDVDLNGDTLIKAICSLDEEDIEFRIEVSPLDGDAASDSVVLFARVDPETGCP